MEAMSIPSSSSPSLAGTWGREKLEKLRSLKQSSDTGLRTTAYKEHFSDKYINEAASKSNNRLSKFKNMKENNEISLNYGVKGHNHSNNNNNNDFTDSNMSTSSLVSISSQNSNNNNDNNNMFVSMKRTKSSVLASGNAPIAVGRSGIRVEKGVAASGLLGEKLCLLPDPMRNTFVQRSWLQCDDPALQYRMNGLPEAFMPTYMSLPIGDNANESNNGRKVEVGWHHGRVNSSITGDPLSKSASKGTFMDYP